MKISEEPSEMASGVLTAVRNLGRSLLRQRKSTLLRILSRITEPTSGRFGVRGRVASLLEVGTGFHPELTGRENIYVSGVTLGMTRAEIKKRFDEIVDFSGVEKFLDTPVKHYSSGMQVRLLFVVAVARSMEFVLQ